jgi:hypothetical protein
MGMRIHKRLGYVLDDVESKDFDITDDRFNLKDGYFGLDYEGREARFTLKGFTKYISAQHKKEMENEKFSMLTFDLHNLKKNVKNILDMVCFESEFGLPNVVMFQPPSKDWSRWDDIIDYMEAGGNGEDKLNILGRPIYPYEMWVNLKTGLNHVYKDDIRFELYEIRRLINWSKEEKSGLGLKAIESWGFDSIEDAEKNIVPGVPEIVKHLCIYLKVFNDDNTVNGLKPAVYTYWS